MWEDLLNFVTRLDFWGIISKVVIIIGAMGTTIKFIIPFIKNLYKKIKSLDEYLEYSLPILQQISKDFKPNGGNSLRDVVDRIERSQILLEEKNKLIIELEGVGIFETDREGKYTWVSDKWIDLTSQSPADAYGNGWLADIDSNDRDRVTEEWEKAVEQNRQFSARYKINNKNISVKAYPLKYKDSKGQVLIGYVGIIVEEKNETIK